MDNNVNLKIKEFHDSKTGTLSYIVYDSHTLDGLVIDSVLNYSSDTKELSNESFLDISSFLKSNNIKLHYILETHVHADHLSGSQLLKDVYKTAKVAINKNIASVQSTFKSELALNNEFITDGHQFDFLLEDQQVLTAGPLNIKVIFTPGHTPACTSFLIEDHLFSGDALFMPDLGTGRCDFPGGSSEQLYNSIANKIYSLPDHYQVLPGHDYPPQNRELKFKATIKDHKNNNIHLKADTTKDSFIKFRSDRDKTLNPPKLIKPSLLVNLNGGRTDFLVKG